MESHHDDGASVQGAPAHGAPAAGDQGAGAGSDAGAGEMHNPATPPHVPPHLGFPGGLAHFHGMPREMGIGAPAAGAGANGAPASYAAWQQSAAQLGADHLAAAQASALKLMPAHQLVMAMGRAGQAGSAGGGMPFPALPQFGARRDGGAGVPPAFSPPWAALPGTWPPHAPPHVAPPTAMPAWGANRAVGPQPTAASLSPQQQQQLLQLHLQLQAHAAMQVAAPQGAARSGRADTTDAGTWPFPPAALPSGSCWPSDASGIHPPGENPG